MKRTIENYQDSNKFAKNPEAKKVTSIKKVKGIETTIHGYSLLVEIPATSKEAAEKYTGGDISKLADILLQYALAPSNLDVTCRQYVNPQDAVDALFKGALGNGKGTSENVQSRLNQAMSEELLTAEQWMKLSMAKNIREKSKLLDEFGV